MSDRYTAEKDFGIGVRGSSLRFRKGQVIENPVIVADLLSARAPIRLIDENDGDTVICPHCRAAFDRKLAEDTDRILREFGR
jgi:hypothetical protein